MIFIKYFLSLTKQLILSVCLILFLPALMIAYKYPTSTILTYSINLYLYAIPWFLWVHQMTLAGFSKTYSFEEKIQTAFFSAFISTCIILSLQSITPKTINSINPQIQAQNILTTPQGTLILDIDQESNRLFARTNTKSLWVGDQNLLFTKITTNNVVINISEPILYQNGFYTMANKGSWTLGLAPYPFYYHNILGQDVIDEWLYTLKMLNFQITGIAIQERTIPKSSPNSTEYADRSQIQQPPTQTSTIVNWLKRFISTFNIMLLGSLLGVLFTFRIHFFTALNLIGFTAIWLPRYFPLVTALSKYIPSQHILPHLGLFLILTVLTSLTILLKYNNTRKGL